METGKKIYYLRNAEGRLYVQSFIFRIQLAAKEINIKINILVIGLKTNIEQKTKKNNKINMK